MLNRLLPSDDFDSSMEHVPFDMPFGGFANVQKLREHESFCSHQAPLNVDMPNTF